MDATVRPERRSAPALPRHDREAGFTLVELVVALALTALVGGSVIALLVRQNRFYGVNDDAVFAEQTLRATVDLFGREVRAASPGDLTAATPDSVTLRVDVHRGVVCRVADQTVTFYVYASPPANVTGPRGTAVTAPYDSVAAHDPDFDAYGSTASASERQACQAAGSPTGVSTTAYRTVDWGGSSLGLPRTGARLRIVAPLTYRVGPSSFSEGLAVRRDGQELAAPFSEAGFRYGLADGSEVASVPPGALGSIRRVRIELVATGLESPRWEVDRPIVYDVRLRN